MAAVAELQVEVDPTEVGLDPERLARLDRFLNGFVERGHLPGTLAVVSRGGRVAHVSRFGNRDVAAGLPVETDTIWRIYSMTKPITSVAALMLYEEGAFELTDPVATLIPAFADVRVYRGGSQYKPSTVPAQEPIRIWHLFTHTSGLTYGFFYRDAVDAIYRAAGFEPFVSKEDYTIEEACDRWGRLPLLFEPGSEWNYSVATDVLGRVVEVASGMTLDEFFAERIFTPLGMPDTGFFVAPENVERAAALYTPNPRSPLEAVPHPSMNKVRTEPPQFLMGGGGLWSTASDYNRFMQLLLGRGELDGVRLLSPRTLELATRNHLPGNQDLAEFGRPLHPELPPPRGVGFGLGFSVVIDPAATRLQGSPGTFGWGGAANTEFFVDPAEELTAAFYTQLLPAYDPLRRSLKQMVYQALVD